MTSRHVRLALAAKAGVGRDAANIEVQWEPALLTALPFQPRAAAILGGVLQGTAALKGTILDTRFLVANALDWGEDQIIECVARAGYGSAFAVRGLDCRSLAGADAIDQLVASYTAGLGVSDSVSRLGRLLNDMSSGVLVFRAFDEAHPAAQHYLLEGLARGSFSDASGRTLHTRTFTSIFLIGPSRVAGQMGLRRSGSSAPTTSPLAARVHACVALERPPAREIVDFVAPAVLAEFRRDTGLQLSLSEEARCYMAGVNNPEGIAACRDRLRIELARCTRVVADVDDARVAGVEIGADSSGLTATLRF